MVLDDPIKVGIVGARFAAEFHYENICRVRGVPVEVVGVTSTTNESRERFASARGIAAFDSVEALIDACDVVNACSPAAPSLVSISNWYTARSALLRPTVTVPGMFST